MMIKDKNKNTQRKKHGDMRQTNDVLVARPVFARELSLAPAYSGLLLSPLASLLSTLLSLHYSTLHRECVSLSLF